MNSLNNRISPKLAYHIFKTSFIKSLDNLEDVINRAGMVYVCTVIFFLTSTSIVFFTPPLQVPDEYNHLVRAYQISEGIFASPIKYVNGHKSSYGEVPISLSKLYSFKNPFDSAHSASIPFIKYTFSVPLEKDKTTIINIPNTGQYSPIPYIPQAIGAWLGMNAGLSLGGTFYLMRFMAVLFSAVCIFLSMRILSEKRLLIFLIAMMPMFLFETASISADAVTYALSILFISYILSQCDSNLPMTREEYFLLAIIALTLGFIKQIYGVILLLYFLIPARRAQNKRRFYLIGLILISMFLASSVFWLYMMGGSEVTHPNLSSVKPKEQISYLINNPMQYPDIILNTITNKFEDYHNQFIGVLGWLKIILPQWFYRFYTIILIISAVCGKLNLSIWQRAFMPICVAISFLVISLNLYITWTPVGKSTVDGIQGRYMIPLAMMILVPLACRRKLKYENITACLAGLTSAVVTILCIYDYLY